MNSIPWVLVGIVVGLVVLAIGMVVALRKRKEARTVDYRNYFVMGVIWVLSAPVMILLPWILHEEEPSFMPIGFVFLAMGVPYMIIGLGNKDKWGKQVEVCVYTLVRPLKVWLVGPCDPSGGARASQT